MKHISMLVKWGACGTVLLIAGCAPAAPAAPADAPVGVACHPSADACNVVSGFSGNEIDSALSGGVVAGGGQRGAINGVSGDFGTVGGGEGNLAGEGSTVGGGQGNTALHFHATVGGGASNLADGQESTVAGGYKNVASERFAVVGGGAGNTASDMDATVGGGTGNVASSHYATVGGGTQNLASSTAAAVSGGDHNLAQGAYSSVLGGINNNASGYIASVGGGAGSTASGSYAAVPGGFANVAAGDYSFAAGRKAEVQAEHPGTFLFADSSSFPFPSLSPDEFAVRASGGVRFVTAVDDKGAPIAGVRLPKGSGSWESLSDFNSKSAFVHVDSAEVLRRLMTIPIMTWSYRGQDPTIRHMGPTAQDFRQAFGLGEDGHYISTVDSEGVALAAIQALYRLMESTQPSLDSAEIATLRRQVALSNALAFVSLSLAGLALAQGRLRQSPPIRSR